MPDFPSSSPSGNTPSRDAQETLPSEGCLADGVIDQYLAGVLPAAQAWQVDREIATRPEWRRFVQVVRGWLSEPDMPSVPTVADAVVRLRERQARNMGRYSTQRLTPSRVSYGKNITNTGRSFGRFATLAVVCGAIAMAGIVEWRISYHRVPTSQIYTAVPGRRAIVALLDGSHVILDAASRMRVVSDRSGAISVVLTGRAYFTVAHHAKVPFVVRTGHLLTRVLGTAFSVRRYDTDRVTTVGVSDGRVSLYDARASHRRTSESILVAGELAIADSNGQIIVMRGPRTEDYTNWMAGRLVFHEAYVRDIVVELRRAYGADIRLSDTTFTNQRLTWTVTTDRQSLDYVVNGLATLLDAHVVRSGAIITIVPGRPAAHRPVVPHSSLSLESSYGR